ncbi:MAG: hypothetical protein AAFY72_14365, partial [Cyanobacteria bacterium J06649_4]
VLPTFVLPSLFSVGIWLPAIAQISATEASPAEELFQGSNTENIDTTWVQSNSTSSFGGSIPPEVWSVMQSQTENSGYDLGNYEGILSGEVSSEDIWNIASSQMEFPSSVEQVFSGGNNTYGSIPAEVWNIMRSQAGLSGSYGNGSYGSLGQIFSGGNNPFDFSSVINRDNWVISSFSDVTPSSTSNSQSAGGWNPFKHLASWIQNTPLAKAMGAFGKQIRGVLSGNSFGFFTRNQIVKERDQANLFDQEIARMMAEPQLGEAGEQWMTTEMQSALTVLGSGQQSAGAAIQIAQDSQRLTSTQDVAKAVAQQGGQNAALSAAVLQMQTQNQASLLQLQQLTSSAIQLSANNSEGIDETNRRERAERTNALRQSASEFIYVPNVFD